MDAPSLIEDIRFGYGPLAGRAPSAGYDADRLMAQLTAEDAPAAQWTPPGLMERWPLIEAYTADRKAKVHKTNPSPGTLRLAEIEAMDLQAWLSRPAVALCGFRERLANLWANRIAVAIQGAALRPLVQPFRDEAVRPHVAGRLADMLKATLWHPAMQIYLTQVQSVGPNSKQGKKRNKGLNENLAREFLELHTMGSGYTQADVTELAKLLAGMKHDAEGPRVEDARQEPGTKTILGQMYETGATEIDRLVEDVAHRPETAEATAFYLARHFIADAPPADLVAAMARAYLDHDTELTPVYRVMLTHPAARAPERAKLRSPQEYVVASLRLGGLMGTEAGLRGFRKDGMKLEDRMKKLGQPIHQAPSPEGWPETSAEWLSPPMVSARLDWAIDMGRAIGTQGADPRALAQFALGDLATPMLHRAVAGAEQKWEGVTVLLSSPDFSRR